MSTVMGEFDIIDDDGSGHESLALYPFSTLEFWATRARNVKITTLATFSEITIVKTLFLTKI